MSETRTVQDLQLMQAAPLSAKIKMTKHRIRDWVNEYGEDGVYVSFSGGKDSTALLTMAREEYPGIKAVYVDTGLEFPEIRDFVKKWDNVEWLKPRMNFKEVIQKYGYPFIGKEVTERVYYAQKYLTWYKQQNHRNFEEWKSAKENGIHESVLREFTASGAKGTYKIKELLGEVKGQEKTQFDYSKWKWLAACPYMVSNKCCDVMKKSPAHNYAKKTGRKMISGQMASESRLRLMQWLHNGCNGFDMKTPVSNPMAFWAEQDVLQYIQENEVPICSIYGEIVEADELPGQMTWEDYAGFDIGQKKLTTTGQKRTGCMFCGFGCHLEKPGEGRFERMKKTHPKQYDYIMRPLGKGGLGYKEVIDWINEHGGFDIRY